MFQRQATNAVSLLTSNLPFQAATAKFGHRRRAAPAPTHHVHILEMNVVEGTAEAPNPRPHRSPQLPLAAVLVRARRLSGGARLRSRRQPPPPRQSPIFYRTELVYFYSAPVVWVDNSALHNQKISNNFDALEHSPVATLAPTQRE